MEKFKFLPKNKISLLPKTSGVYAFKKARRFLYIGKAANLRERVNQHRKLLNLVKQLGYIKTNSEIEALLLEAKLIKKCQPKYNVVWRDDKNYFYVCITKEDFPRAFVTHQPVDVGCPRVGPFVDGNALKQTLKILRKVFPYRTCKNLPKRPCLWYQLNRCPAPCLIRFKFQIPNLKKISQKNAKNLIKILLGKKRQVLTNLKKEMKEAAGQQDFEKAATIRDQVQSLEKILSHTKIIQNLFTLTKPWLYYCNSRVEAYDVSNIQGKEATGAMVTFVQGKPDKNFYRRFKIKIEGKPNDIAMIKEVLNRRFDHPEWPFPDLILIDGGRGQLNAALKIKDLRLKIKNIKVISLAKKENKLYIEGKKEPVLLKNLPREIFNLILQLRDEAHRFARKYHHKLREIDFFANS